MRTHPNNLLLYVKWTWIMMISLHVRSNFDQSGTLVSQYIPWLNRWRITATSTSQLKKIRLFSMKSECSEGTTRKPIGTDFPRESTTVVTINDRSYMFVFCVPSISKHLLQLGTNNFEDGPDQCNVSKYPPLSEVI